MSEPARFTIVGNEGSPYSRKLRAVLRYRRIPFRWLRRGGPEDVGVPKTRIDLIPVLVFPDGEAMVDTTFQIRRLEGLATERSVLPPDPVLCYLDALIEDYADEWLTKAMFHYRWAFPADIEKASRVLPLARRLDLSDPDHERLARVFAERQVRRLAVVGSNPTTSLVIEESYWRLLHILNRILQVQPFLMGGRPGTADFGVFGQLTQLALFDPTSVAVAERETPRVIAWVQGVEDLASLQVGDADWGLRDATAARLQPLLSEIGRVYVPFLVANAVALESGAEHVECTIDGRLWVQKPFPYQGKCLRELRRARGELAADECEQVDKILAGTGCEALFA